MKLSKSIYFAVCQVFGLTSCCHRTMDCGKFAFVCILHAACYIWLKPVRTAGIVGCFEDSPSFGLSFCFFCFWLIWRVATMTYKMHITPYCTWICTVLYSFEYITLFTSQRYQIKHFLNPMKLLSLSIFHNGFLCILYPPLLLFPVYAQGSFSSCLSFELA